MKSFITARIASGTAVAALLLIGGVASAQSTAYSSQFGMGSQGDNVTSLQTFLTTNGYYSGPITGYFGVLTQAGVQRYQTALGISATGYVGPLTLTALRNGSGASSSTSGNSNAALIASLQAQVQALLLQIQALGNSSGGSNLSLQTTMGVSVSSTLGASGTGPFIYTITTNPLNGTIGSFNSTTGAYTYTPNTNYVGNDSFSYTVTNSAGTSAPTTITVNVAASNTAPMGQAISFSTQNGAAYNGTLLGSGSGTLTYAISTQPSYGTISNFNASTGGFTYTPTSGNAGSDSFTYTVTNSAGVSSPVTVTVTNGSSSGTPAGQSISISTSNGASYNGTLSGSGSGTLTYTIVSQPTHGTVNSFTPATGAFTYTPSTGYRGSDSFTYTVGNGSSTSAVNTVTITNN